MSLFEEAPIRPPESLPEEVQRLVHSNEPVWAAHSREARRLGVSSLDVFFLAFLKRVQRFGYFTLGPITIDVHLIEDIVERTAVPAAESDPPFGEDMTRFSHLLAEEVARSGRRRLDDLHVLLALARVNEGLPGRVFGELGVSPEQIERLVRGEPSLGREEKLYSPEEAAEYLGVHVQTVRAWIRSGRLKASRLAGQRALRIRSSDLLSVLEPVEPNDDV